MKKVVGVGFKDGGKIYWFNPDPFKLKVGSMIVVETIRGLELGKVVKPIQEIEDEKLEKELKDVVRPATEKDIRNFIANEAKAEEDLPIVKNIIEEHKLDMKVVGIEYTLDGTKLLIYYNAEGRVDFRELVKSLAAVMHVRIELRQIGQREGAKMMGGIGICGRELCCAKHLREFDLVTMKMAKDQNMSLTASKITGLCGKLMCCIGYEEEVYSEARKRLPDVGDIVDTPSCKGCEVVNVDFLREIISVKNEDSIEKHPAKDVKCIVSKHKNKDKNLNLDTDELKDLE